MSTYKLLRDTIEGERGYELLNPWFFHVILCGINKIYANFKLIKLPNLLIHILYQADNIFEFI